ncbi:MAG: hypothetical protein AAGD25_14515 [Cyanobacteria bacterium P01_F01_bin.150]
MINRLAWALTGGISLAIAHGTAQAVKAESINIIFSGVVPATCTISTPPQVSSTATPSNPTNSVRPHFSPLNVACNDTTQINHEQWEPHANDESTITQHRDNPWDTSENIVDGYRTIIPQ